MRSRKWGIQDSSCSTVPILSFGYRSKTPLKIMSLRGVGASSSRELGRVARLRLSRYGLGHAVQAQCRAPPPYPEDPLSDPELAGLRGWSEAARRADTLAGRVRHCRLASAAADHARRSGPVFGRRDRVGVD